MVDRKIVNLNKILERQNKRVMELNRDFIELSNNVNNNMKNIESITNKQNNLIIQKILNSKIDIKKTIEKSKENKKSVFNIKEDISFEDLENNAYCVIPL